MRLSIETKVAASVAIAFVGIGIGAIAKEGNKHASAGLGPMSVQVSDISLSLQNASSENRLLVQY